MALSEHEQRMLDAIEHALFEDDPKFASNVNPARMRRRRPVLAVVLFVVGLVALVVGVIAAQSLFALGVVVSVVGFVVMVCGVGLFVYGVPGGHSMADPRKPGKAASPLSTRMEERFRRRFDDR